MERSTRPERIAAVVAGGSAGAIEALAGLLGGLPAELAVPVVVVVHLPRQRASVLAEVIGHRSRLPVREIEDKAPLTAGVVHVAPPDYHVLIDTGPVFALSVETAVNFSIPSIDVLFESAAELLGARVAGVVLSGANDDGARGLAAIARAGGPVFVQAPEEAAMPAMPAAARAACPQAVTGPVAEIARALARLVGGVNA